MQILKDFTGNLTRDLPACGAVPPPTTLARTARKTRAQTNGKERKQSSRYGD